MNDEYNGWDYGPGNIDDNGGSGDFWNTPNFGDQPEWTQSWDDNAFQNGNVDSSNYDQYMFDDAAQGTGPNATGYSGTPEDYDSQFNPGQQLTTAWQNSGTSDFLSRMFSNPQNITKVLGGLQEMYANKKKAGALNGIARQQMRQMDPFGSQRGQYQQLLSQTYTDPNVVLNRPEIKAQLAQMRRTMEAKDAAAGRRSQYGNREVQLAQESAGLVDKYRAQLASLAGSQFGPNTAQAAQMAGTGANYGAQGVSPLLNVASNILQNQSLADLLSRWQR